MSFSTTTQLGNNTLYFYTTVQIESGHYVLVTTDMDTRDLRIVLAQ